MDDLEGLRSRKARHRAPRVVADSCGALEDCRDIAVVVEPRREHVVEAGCRDVGEVLLGDEAPVGDKRDLPDAEAGLVVGHHLWQRRRVPGVAGKDVVGDRDPVAGDEQADHDLGAVASLVTAVAVGTGGELLGGPTARLEIGRGQVVEGEAEVEVRQVREAAVEDLLGRFLLLGDHVESAVALVEERGGDPVGQRDGAEPFENGVALGPRIQKPVRHHHEHRVGKVLVTPPLTEGCEVGAKTDAVEVRSDRRHGTIGRSTRSLQLVGRNPVLCRVARERGHDAIELSGALELADLTQAEQLPLGVLAACAHGFDERQVRVALVASLAYRPLHVHHAEQYRKLQRQSRICRPYISLTDQGPGEANFLISGLWPSREAFNRGLRR